MSTKLSVRIPLVTVFGVWLAILGPRTSLASVVYSETASGDLPGDQSAPLLIGSFGLGTNTVLGHYSLDSDTVGPGAGDTFGLTLSAGQHIDSIVLHVTDNTNVADQFSLTIFQSPFTQVDQQVLSPGGEGSFSFAPFATQSPGQYNFSIQAETGNDTANGFNWEWDINVTSVPEPSAWAMMLIGFAGLGFAGCRASRKSAAGPA